MINKLKNILYNISTWCIRFISKDSNLVKHFKSECEFISKIDNDKMQKLMNRNVEDILSIISSQGHSGFSISYMKSMLNKAIDFKPLSKLTLNDDEFSECYEGTMQNKRDSRIFKYDDGTFSFNDAIRYTPVLKFGIDAKSNSIYKEKSIGSTWNGPIIVIPSSGKAYHISDVRIKNTESFNASEFNIKTIEIEYPEGWWLSVCMESDIKEFSEMYTYTKDYEYVKKEVNFKNGIYRKEIIRLMDSVKKHLYKSKKAI